VTDGRAGTLPARTRLTVTVPLSGSRAFPALGYGVGLRPPHYGYVLESRPAVDWFEVIAENFLVRGGRPLETLTRVRESYPVVLHGVSLSIGSTDPLDGDYLRQLRRLADRVQPAWLSDHLCWTGVGGHTTHDLLPLPYTEETLAHVAERVERAQTILGRRIALENVSSYLTFCDSAIPEWEFLAAVADRADCAILLDVNNVYVSAYNHGFDAHAYLAAIPPERVVQFHLAGHSEHGTHLLDTHDHPVCAAVWALYAAAVRRFGPRPTLIERDDHIPDFPTLHAEAARAAAVAADLSDDGACRHPTAPLAPDHRA
jgi:uncharacterized protein (UPF0276 family)